MIQMRPLVLALAAAAVPFFVQDPETPPAPQTATVGAPAPTLRLNNSEGVPVQALNEGRWSLLAFYPKAATPG